MSTIEDKGYSAEVDLALEVGEDRRRVAQVGPESLILDDGETLPEVGQDAKIIITVDGNRHEYVVIVHKIEEQQRRVFFF